MAPTLDFSRVPERFKRPRLLLNFGNPRLEIRRLINGA
jgi:hypothetical protein